MWNNKSKKEQFICSGKTPEQAANDRKYVEEVDKFLEEGKVSTSEADKLLKQIEDTEKYKSLGGKLKLIVMSLLFMLLLPPMWVITCCNRSPESTSKQQTSVRQVQPSVTKVSTSNSKEVNPSAETQIVQPSQKVKTQSTQPVKTDSTKVEVKGDEVTVTKPSPHPTENNTEDSTNSNVSVNTTVNVTGNANVNVNTTVNVQ